MDRTSKTHVTDAASAAGEAGLLIKGLIDRRDALLASEPGLRGRGLADRLDVSEAQLLLLERGRSARLLRSEWPEIIGELPGLGTVMALTRNECVLHEKIGRYGEVILKGSGTALVVGEEINLRLFFDRWRFGFAVQEGILNSLQFFDRFGSAVHKLYLLDDSDVKAFCRLADSFEYRSDSLSAIETRPLPAALPCGSTIDIARFWSEWDSPRDLHDFSNLLAVYGLRHIHAFRLAGDRRARQLSAGTFGRALKMAAASATPTVVQIESAGAVQLHAGIIEHVSRNDRWLNVIDPTFNFHLLEEAIAETWVVSRPAAKGPVISLEALDLAGNSIASIFSLARLDSGSGEPWGEIVKAL